MISKPHCIRRRNIDNQGQSGSLYDAVYDRLIPEKRFEGKTESYTMKKSAFKLFLGDSDRNIYDYLREFYLGDPMIENLAVGMIEPFGISSMLDYEEPIDEHIALFYFVYAHKAEYFSDCTTDFDEFIELPATHTIGKVTYGFEFVCLISVIDQNGIELLRNTIASLLTHFKSFRLKDKQKKCINLNKILAIYGSSKCTEVPPKSLSKLLENIRQWQKISDFHQAVEYKLVAIQWLFSGRGNRYFKFRSENIRRIRNLFEKVDEKIREINRYNSKNLEKLPYKSLHEQKTKLDKCSTDQIKTYRNLQEKYRKVLIEIRRTGQMNCEINFEQELASQLLTVTELSETIRTFQTKADLIEQLRRDSIKYIDASYICMQKRKYTSADALINAVENALTKRQRQSRIFWASEELKRKKPDSWTILYHTLLAPSTEFPGQNQLFYVDFTDCVYSLRELFVEKVIMNDTSKIYAVPRADNQLTTEEQRLMPMISSSTTNPKTTINILLLGEIGVGKSTFINAFVNHLAFESFEKAEYQQPITLISTSSFNSQNSKSHLPSSNVIGYGSNEGIIEQHEFMTKKCSSYVFDVHPTIELRFIDTPGFSETRNIQCDAKIIEKILDYIDNYSSLHAICILLQPTSSRLKTFFQECLHQFFTYLSPTAHENIVFCFTKTRSTFFGPGDSGIILRNILQRLTSISINFNKNNIFCFDNESIQYLMNEKENFDSKSTQRKHCALSWSKSALEFIRFIRSIQQRSPYQLDQRQTLTRSIFQLTKLVRPILETLRLFIYNRILDAFGLDDQRIVLRSTWVTQLLCSHCAESEIVLRKSIQIQHYNDVKRNDRQECRCTENEHDFLIEHIVKYQCSISLTKQQKEENIRHYNQLIKCLEHPAITSCWNRFKTIVDKFLIDEQNISMMTDVDSKLNEKVVDEWIVVRRIFEKNQKQSENSTFEEIDQLINSVKIIPQIQIQLKDISDSRRLSTGKMERRITNDRWIGKNNFVDCFRT